MHLFYQGIISRVLVKMFAGTFWADQGTPQGDDGMKIPRGIWIRMGRELAVCIRSYSNIYTSNKEYRMAKR